MCIQFCIPSQWKAVTVGQLTSIKISGMRDFYMSGIRFFCESVECCVYLEINEKEIDVVVKIRACSDMGLILYWQKVYFLGELEKTITCLISFWMQIILYISITQLVEEWTWTPVVPGSSSAKDIKYIFIWMFTSKLFKYIFFT